MCFVFGVASLSRLDLLVWFLLGVLCSVGLLALERADAALQAPDAPRVAADLGRQEALGPLAASDLALRDLDLALDVVEATARRSSALREHGQDSPERERKDRSREQDAKTHAAPHATSAFGQGST